MVYDSEEGESTLVVGILALQGAFREHLQHIERLNPFQSSSKQVIHLQPILIRTSNDLARCDALIIPGGESTAIALGAQRAHLLEPLRDWIRDDKPTWGTCAGMILLAREATGGKKSGQELLGGLDIRVGRNGYGSQVDSFEEQLEIPALSKPSKGEVLKAPPLTFPGVFIRAPVIESLLLPNDLYAVESNEATKVARGEGEAHEKLKVRPQKRVGEGSPMARPQLQQQASSFSSTTSTESTMVQLAVAPPLERPNQERKSRPALEILASLSHLPRGAKGSVGGSSSSSSSSSRHDAEEDSVVKGPRPEHDSMIVALKQGKIMCTSFHPELTGDTRLHHFFLQSCVFGQQQ